MIFCFLVQIVELEGPSVDSTGHGNLLGASHIVVELYIYLVQDILKTICLGALHHVGVNKPQGVLNCCRVDLLIQRLVLLDGESLVWIFVFFERKSLLDISIPVQKVCISSEDKLRKSFNNGVSN